MEYALQSSDDGRDWSDEMILGSPEDALNACFDARQKTHRIHYRAIMRLTCVISPINPDGRSHL